MEFPDVSEGRNIERINLFCCESLVKLPPSIQHLPKLGVLDLSFCESLESVPTTFDSKVLEVINLIDCGCVKMFPQVASQGNIIRNLHLDGTDIREVPSSVELLKGLEKLSMRGCKKLSIISTNICKLNSLLKLVLRFCKNLESFPEIMEPMESLRSLDLSECTRLKRLPNDHSFHNLKSLEELDLSGTAITELPSSIQHLICLQNLSISGCQNLTSLSSMKQLSQLLHLVVNGCSNLCSLPELPSSLDTLNANGCVSLKTISSACFSSESRTRCLEFANCFKSDEEERRRVLDIAFSIIQHKLNTREILNHWRFHYSLDRQKILNYKEFQIILPWSEIPQWFCGSQSVGSSLTLKLPMDDQCYRFAFSVVMKPNYANCINAEDYSKLQLPIFNYLKCYVDDDCYGRPVTSCELDHLSSDIEHLSLWHHPWDVELRKYFKREVSLQFRDKKGEVEVTRCGVVIL